MSDNFPALRRLLISLPLGTCIHEGRGRVIAAELEALLAIIPQTVPLCIGMPTINRLVKEQQVQFDDGRGLIADSHLADEITRMQSDKRMLDQMEKLWVEVHEPKSPEKTYREHLAGILL